MITRRLLQDEDLLFLKRPEAKSASDDPAVAQRVSEMLLELQRDGEDAVRRHSRHLDGWEPDDFEITRAEIDGAGIDPEVREHLQRPRARDEASPELALDAQHLERELSPGLFVGHRQVPVQGRGA